MITVREQRGHMYGTAYTSDYRIAPGTSLPARAVVMIRGTPRKNDSEDLAVVLGISDEDGHEQRITVLCGHSHGIGSYQRLRNLEVKTGGWPPHVEGYGNPIVQATFEL